MTLRKQIFIGFGGTALLVIAVTVTVLLLNNRLSYALEKVVASNWAEQQIAERMLVEVEFMNRAERLSAVDLLAREFVGQFLRNLRRQANALFQATGAGLELALEGEVRARRGEEEAELSAITQLLATISALETELEGIAPGEDDRIVFARALEEEITPLVQALHEDATSEFSEELTRLQALTAQTYDTIRLMALAAGIVIVITAIHLAFGFSRPLGSMARATREISRGNFNFQIDYDRPNEIGALARSFNQMSEKLKGTTLSRDLVETIIDSLGSGIVVLDEERRVTRVNRGLSTLLGYRELELCGKRLEDFVAEGSGLPEPKTDHLNFELSESQIRHSDGGVIPVNLIESPISRGSVTQGSVVIMQDLRPFKESQEALIDGKREAEMANAMKSQFLANMSHEMRTPMNGVVGMTDLLLETDLNEEQRSHLKTVQTASSNLLRVLNDVLDFARMDAGQVRLAPEKVSLAKLLERTVSLFTVSAGEQKTRLALDLAPDLPAAAELDGARLRQILVHLLSNAVKFTPGGVVVLRVTQSGSTVDHRSLRFEVKDTGKGIPPEHHETIFRPFEQVDGSLSREASGSGLGLGICASLLELMDSRMQLVSEVGVGSTFSFELKIPGKGWTEASAVTAISQTSIRRAVVFEPVASIREVVHRSLGRLGYDCGSSASAAPSDYAADELNSAALIWIGHEAGSHARVEVDRVLNETASDARIIIVCDSADLEQHGLSGSLARDDRVRFFTGALLPSKFADQCSWTGNEAKANGSDTNEAPELTARLRILMVDDESINCRVGSLVLEKRGHFVHTEKSAVAALERLESETFDVILMDIQMPQMNGFEATAEIRRREEADRRMRCPIIACTAHAIEGYDVLCREKGMDGYIAKPIKADMFSAQIVRIFQQTPEELNLA